MRKFLFWDWRYPGPGERFSVTAHSVSWLMLSMFTIGILAGCLVGLFAPPAGLPGDVDAYLSAEVFSARSFPVALWNSGKFFLLLLALSSSFFGVFALPFASLLRGYLLSCSVSALFSACSWQGLCYSFLISGIPALLAVPCFLIASCDAFASSRQLLALRVGHRTGASGFRRLRRFPVIAFVILLNTCYRCWLLPEILISARPY